MKKTVWALTFFWAALIVVGVAFAGEEKKPDLFLGVYVDEVTSEIADDYGVKAGEGVLVSGTVDGSSADEAGLRANDILVKLDSADLTGPAELRHQIQKHKAGDKVSLTYKRGGKAKTVEVALTEREQCEMLQSMGDNRFEWSDEGGKSGKSFKFFSPKSSITIDDDDEDIAFAGVVTQELGEGLQQYFKVENGALISEVVKDSPAEKAGLKAGDVIIKIGDRDIDDTGDVSKAIHKLDPGESADFVVMREGAKKTMTVTLTSRGEHYGNTEDIDIRLGLAPDCREIDGYIVLPNGDFKQFTQDLSVEMEELNRVMENLNIEVEDLPDVHMDLSIDPAPPIGELNFDQTRAIRNDTWWKKSWNEMKDKLEVELEELKANFEQLKAELKQLQEEFKQRML
jgi:hypothetical protein